MRRIATAVVVEGLLVVTGLIAAGPAAAGPRHEDRVASSVEPASQQKPDPGGDSSKAEVPSNTVTSKEPEPKSSTEKAPSKKTTRRNPDYDSSGNIVLDLGAKINDMEVVEDNLVVVSPTAEKGKMFFVHIEPGAGLKGVKVTDTFGYITGTPNRLDQRMMRPCVVVFDKKRFGDPEDNAGRGDNKKAEEDGYLRVVIHCAGGGEPTRDGTLIQALNLVNTPNPDSSAGANPYMANPIVRIPVSINKKDGRLVAYPERVKILSDLSPENTGLFKSKMVTAAGAIGLKRSVKIGKVKVEVDKDQDTCLVISDPDAPPPPPE